MKPRLFIGSSEEGVGIAYAVQSNLTKVAQVTVWTQGVFGLSTTILDDLLDCVNNSDFGVFVFSPDDVTRIRGKENQTVRDNVLVELGMFVSRLGKERCYVLLPKRDEDIIHLPTDLIGMMPATYEEYDNGNWEAATGQACFKVSNLVRKLGPFSKDEAAAERESLSNRLSEVETEFSAGMGEMSRQLTSLERALANVGVMARQQGESLRRLDSLEEALKRNLALAEAAQSSGAESRLAEQLGRLGEELKQVRSLSETELPKIGGIGEEMREIQGRLSALETSPGTLSPASTAGRPTSPAVKAKSPNDLRWLWITLTFLILLLLFAGTFWLRN
jgi:hypothetical protein